jgi:hypothetical protein
MKNREMLEAQKELLAYTFSQAQSYTNLIIVAGYAGFFAIWTQMAGEMAPATRFWSGLLISISVAGFIGWEVYGMILRSKSMFGVARAVNDPQRYEELIAQHRAEQKEVAIQVGRIWLIALPFIAGTAFLALLIILSFFIHSLWVTYFGA